MGLRTLLPAALILPVLILVFSVFANALPPHPDQQVLANILEEKPLHTTALLAGAAMLPTTPTPIVQSHRAKFTQAAGVKLRSRLLNFGRGNPNAKTEEGEDMEPL